MPSKQGIKTTEQSKNKIKLDEPHATVRSERHNPKSLKNAIEVIIGDNASKDKLPAVISASEEKMVKAKFNAASERITYKKSQREDHKKQVDAKGTKSDK